MKFFRLIILAAIAAACQQSPQQPQTAHKQDLTATGTFGDELVPQNAVPAAQLAVLFTDSDTVEVTLSGDIASSCKHSGCWMDLDMGNSESVHVTFRDERFTIPLDAAGKHAIAQGIAIRSMIPVETLQNYAREEGKSEEEINAITQPAWNYELIATGVLIEE